MRSRGARRRLGAKVEALIAERKAASYAEAVGILGDLRALGSPEGRAANVDARIERLRERHARKSRFGERLRNAGLLGGWADGRRPSPVRRFGGSL